MNNNKELLEKIKSGAASWSDYSKLLEFNDIEIKPFFKLAKSIKKMNFQNELKIYIPNKRFPAISVTGGNCALKCEHCDKKYLNGMKPLLTNDELETFLMDLYKNSGLGVLLSGGCEPDGSVPLLGFLDTIRKVKDQTDLIINAHTGLLDEETAKKLGEGGVDIISFDMNMDEKIISDIYHLNKNLDDYKRAVNLLKKNNLNIVPHICIGLYYGKLHKELDSIRFIKESCINPSLIVLIALIPPKRENSKFKQPTPIDIAKIITVIRFVFPNTEISLGCMRPRGDIKIEIEKLAIEAGINRIEIPSPKTLKWVQDIDSNITFKFFSACCAIPKKFETKAKSDDADIKRYLNILKL